MRIVAMERVTDPADPNRCKGSAQDGQCQNFAEPGAEYCRACGGTNLQKAKDVRGYLLSQAHERTRLASISEDLEPVKELRDAIGLQHMLIERRYNMIKDDADLLVACGPLNAMLQTMERLVNSCHRIETNLGQLLARQAILTLAKAMVEIVIDELEGIEDYEAIIDRITARLVNTIQGVSNSKNQSLLTPPLDVPPLDVS